MSLLSRLDKQKNGASGNIITGEKANQSDRYADLKACVHKETIEAYNQLFLENSKDNLEKDINVMDLIVENLNKQNPSITRIEEKKLAQEIYDDVVGLGPLEPLIRDKTISEIMVNNAEDVYVERKGKIEYTGVTFKDDAHVVNVINRIVGPIGRRCDEASPMVDARLPDGSRVNAVIPPVALKGPNITIRKFSDVPLKVSDLISFNSLSYPMAAFLEACVKGKCNMIVSGGTGSGKTTLLNVLSSYIPEDERIVTIEDAAELRLEQKHVITLESRPANVEGTGTITIRDLVKNSLRMRPDRIVVGEVRSGEALDMLQAMNTGHEGSLTTAHANTQRDLLSRIETMVMMAGMELPIKAIREQVVSAIDIVVHQSRLRDGSRKITAISEVVGMEGDVITMQDIFVYEQTGLDNLGMLSGQFVATGIRPQILKKLRENGILVKDEWFGK